MSVPSIPSPVFVQIGPTGVLWPWMAGECRDVRRREALRRRDIASKQAGWPERAQKIAHATVFTPANPVPTWGSISIVGMRLLLVTSGIFAFRIRVAAP